MKTNQKMKELSIVLSLEKETVREAGCGNTPCASLWSETSWGK